MKTKPDQGQADQEAADQVDQERAQRKAGDDEAEPQRGLPAQQRAQRGAERDRAGLERGRGLPSARALRLYNELPVLALLLIVWLVLAKPF